MKKMVGHLKVQVSETRFFHYPWCDKIIAPCFFQPFRHTHAARDQLADCSASVLESKRDLRDSTIRGVETGWPNAEY
jgi:hypothetical protein